MEAIRPGELPPDDGARFEQPLTLAGKGTGRLACEYSAKPMGRIALSKASAAVYSDDR
jgi:hypothetical protein